MDQVARLHLGGRDEPEFHGVVDDALDLNGAVGCLHLDRAVHCRELTVVAVRPQHVEHRRQFSGEAGDLGRRARAQHDRSALGDLLHEELTGSKGEAGRKCHQVDGASGGELFELAEKVELCALYCLSQGSIQSLRDRRIFIVPGMA